MDEQAFLSSAHSQQEMTCVTCHARITGYPHPLLEAHSVRSFQLEQYQTCRQCHDPAYHEWMESTHAREIADDNWNAAVCTDCHSAHAAAPSGEPRAKIAQTCSKCHAASYEQYLDSAHGQAQNTDAPTCTSCHGAHTQQCPHTPEFRINSPDMCADCHADEAMMSKYDISSNVYDTYVADFHGRTVALFQHQSPHTPTDMPVCYDCHGAHDAKSASDPDSWVHPENLLQTCTKCHTNAPEGFSDAWLGHYEPDLEKFSITYLIELLYKLIIPAVIGFMMIYVLIDAGSHLARRFIKSQRGKK